MNDAIRVPIESKPQSKQRAGLPSAAPAPLPPVPVPAQPAQEKTPAADECEKGDQARSNPASKASTYGFGTPAEGFGPRRHHDKPGSR